MTTFNVGDMMSDPSGGFPRVQRQAKDAWQIFEPKPLIMASFGGVNSSNKTLHFRVPTPDSRLRMKIAIMFALKAGTTVAANFFTNQCSLWLYAADKDNSGLTGATIPVVNLEGTEAAPFQFPAADGLLGYAREFVTAADFIEGVVTLTNVSTIVSGSWILKTRYQPDSVEFNPDAWNQITQQCVPTLNDLPFNLA